MTINKGDEKPAEDDKDKLPEVFKEWVAQRQEALKDDPPPKP